VTIDQRTAEAVDTGMPDHVIRLRAVNEALDRAYGKPTTRTELTGQLNLAALMAESPQAITDSQWTMAAGTLTGGGSASTQPRAQVPTRSTAGWARQLTALGTCAFERRAMRGIGGFDLGGDALVAKDQVV
jgi:hypothetical protein